MRTPRISEALACFERFLADERHRESLWLRAYCHNSLGEAYIYLGKASYGTAHTALQSALEDCVAFGLDALRSSVLHNQAELLLDEDHLREAIESAEEGLRLANRNVSGSLPRDRGDHHAALARAYLLQGQFSQAAEAARQAAEECLRAQRPWARLLYAMALYGEARTLASEMPQYAEAERVFAQAASEAAALLVACPEHLIAAQTHWLALYGLALCRPDASLDKADRACQQALTDSVPLGIAQRMGRLYELLRRTQPERTLVRLSASEGAGH